MTPITSLLSQTAIAAVGFGGNTMPFVIQRRRVDAQPLHVSAARPAVDGRAIGDAHLPQFSSKSARRASPEYPNVRRTS